MELLLHIGNVPRGIHFGVPLQSTTSMKRVEQAVGIIVVFDEKLEPDH